jgi:monovalent cation/hydrogen antiporter
MQGLFIEYIYLILIILALIMISEKLKIAYPIVLVLGGLVLSLLTRFSGVAIHPELVFLIFLPPLLYEAAWQTSWKEFWKWRRVIMSFAFPIVIITSCVVAFLSTAIIPGFTLALGFLLGGIISPPDAISATTIMRQVKVPKSLVSIIEGESLLNDASSLIVFRFALAAVITGQFSFQGATGSFFLVILMGALIGIGVALIFYAIHRWLPTTSSIEIILTLLTPYCMYYFAEHFHFSGVLAVVCGGLFLSNRRQSILSYKGRIEGINVWGNIVFVFNGLIFLLIGLQLPLIISQLGEVSVKTAIGYGLAISLVLILTRFACTFGAALFTRVVSRFITVAEANPGWKMPLVSSWAGMRGVVSLAAALSVPLLANGRPFPYRDLILFITFVVILVTLVLQGLTLPWLIRIINLEDKHATLSVHEQELILQKKMALYAQQYLQEHYNHTSENPYLTNLKDRLAIDLKIFEKELKSQSSASQLLISYQQAHLKVLEQQRHLLTQINQKSEFDEDLIRKYLSLVDMEELKIREKMQ